MAKAATASPAPARPAAAAPAAPVVAVAAPVPVEGSGSSPAPTSAEAPPKRAARIAPEPEAEREPTPSDAVKAEKLDFAERMRRAKRAAKDKAAGKTAAPAASTATAEPAAAGEPEGQAAKTPAGASGKSARELLDAGDLDGAFEAAFGKKPQDFKIDSRRWEEWRKAGQRQKRELDSRKQSALDEITKRETEATTIIANAKREYGPMIEGRKAFEAGDVVRAVELCFGVDLNGLQKKALAQFHGKNPEVEALRNELAAERRERLEREKRERSEAEGASLERQRAEHRDLIRQTLIDGKDPALAQLAVKPGFVRRVFQIQAQHYDAATEETVAIEDAAAMARQEILDEFGVALGGSAHRSESAETAQAGSKPANAENGKKPTSRTLSQRGAVEASEPGRALTQQERIRKYTELAKAQRPANG